MKYEVYILKWAVELENKMCNRSLNKTVTKYKTHSLNLKEVSQKFPKIKFSILYGDIEKWIALKEIFSVTI